MAQQPTNRQSKKQTVVTTSHEVSLTVSPWPPSLEWLNKPAYPFEGKGWEWKVIRSKKLPISEHFPVGQGWASFISQWPPPPFDKSSEIIERALRLISVSSDDEESCREHLASSIAMSKVCYSVEDLIKPGGAIKMELDTLAKSIKKTARLMEELSCESIAILFGEVAAGLVSDGRKSFGALYLLFEGLAQLVEDKMAHVPVRKGAPKSDASKLRAAGCAYLSLTRFGGTPPTLTVGGPYYELASVLYEAITGKKSIDLQRQCKIMFAVFKEAPP
jgi:hypothetical protein